jgi:DNA-binding GntR family transcriptional regulator
MRRPAGELEAGDERLSLTAYNEIRRRILDNEMPAGTMMLETELAALLAMSRTPVREALIRLSNEGMVEVRPRHGMRVLPVSADDMEEIYEILTALEASAAARIADHGLSAKELKALHAAVRDMDRTLEADDLQAWARADEHFHATLLDACRNRRLRELVYQFWDQTYRVRMLTLRLRPKPVESNRDHLALVQAIQRRDPDEAALIHRQHRQRAGRMLVDLLRRGISQL